MKIAIAVIIGVIGLGAIAAIVYFGWGTVTQSVISILPGGGEKTPPPPSRELPFKAVSQSPVFDYWLKGSDIFGVGQDGKIFRFGENKEQAVSSQEIAGLVKVLPSPDGRRAIIGFGNVRRPQFSIFSADEQSWRPLPLEVLNLVWVTSNGGNNLIALNERKPFVALETLNVSGETSVGKTTILKDLALEDFDLSWFSPNTLRFSDKPSFQFSGSAWELNLSSGELTRVLGPEAGLTIKWSVDGSWGLKFSSKDNSAIVNRQGKILQKLALLALPPKCAPEENFIYCFVPRNANGGILWPDDYLQKSLYTEDDVYKINVNDGQAEKIFDAADFSVDGFNPKISGKQLLFINRYDQKLYSLPL